MSGERVSRRKPENYYEMLGDDFDNFMSDYDVERRLHLIKGLYPQAAAGPSLEVGCGTGAVTTSLLDMATDLMVTDLSAMLAARVGRTHGIPWRDADANSLPFEDNSFGMVISSECVEHTPDPGLGIREMIRVVRPGGYVVFTTPNRLWYPVVRGAQLARVRKYQGNEVFLSIRQMKEAVIMGGAVPEAVAGCHLFPWQIPASKRVLRRLDKYGDRLHRLMINVGMRARKV